MLENNLINIVYNKFTGIILDIVSPDCPIDDNDDIYVSFQTNIESIDFSKIVFGNSKIIINSESNFEIEYNYDYELEIEINREKLRNLRKEYLKAFDIWEKAVTRGREEDSENIMQWYQDILNLKSDAFENIPNKIKYYMGGN